MKKHFINFLMSRDAYDEFIRAFICSNQFYDFTYFIEHTAPSEYVFGAFTVNESTFSRDEFSTLHKEWNKRLTQIQL